MSGGASKPKRVINIFLMSWPAGCVRQLMLFADIADALTLYVIRHRALCVDEMSPVYQHKVKKCWLV